MSPSKTHEDPDRPLTEWLQRASRGDEEGLSRLLRGVYRELRTLARSHMRRERGNHTLAPTDLVHEAYLRLFGELELPLASRSQFFAAAATAMRRVLIDHARKKGSLKRGGDREQVPISVLELMGEETAIDILALDEAISRLEEEDPRAGSVVRLRFYAGLGIDETAEVLSLSRRTVLREWEFARAYLYEKLTPRDDAT